jgi:hypothetical protein
MLSRRAAELVHWNLGFLGWHSHKTVTVLPFVLLRELAERSRNRKNESPTILAPATNLPADRA